MCLQTTEMKLHEHSQNLQPVDLPGRRTIARNESWSQLLSPAGWPHVLRPSHAALKGGAIIILRATVHSCQGSA